LSLSSQKYEFGIRDPEQKPIPDPGSRGKKAPDPDPQHCFFRSGNWNYTLVFTLQGVVSR